MDGAVNLLEIEDEAELAKPWAAWTPKVGDPVRVRLNGECREEFGAYMSGSWRPSRTIVHEAWQDGLTGTVTTLKTLSSGHPIGVDFDDPYLTEVGLCLGWSYAVAELEPLEPRP